MQFDTYSPDIRRELSKFPGGCELAAGLIEKLEIDDQDNILDLRPGSGVLASLVAREFNVAITALASDPESNEAICSRFNNMDADGRLQVVLGTTSKIPVESQTYNSIYCMGDPFLPGPLTFHAMELYRILKPAGRVVLAGPVSITNKTPGYMSEILKSSGKFIARTPAYSALLFGREGFHIISAEYVPDAWDMLTNWIVNNTDDVVPESLRRAIIEDGGRWLSLGSIVLRKPPKPDWAL